MQDQALPSGESTPTDVTGEGRDTGVRARVLDQRVSLGERPTTDVTRRLLTVAVHVKRQHRTTGQYFAAGATVKRITSVHFFTFSITSDVIAGSWHLFIIIDFRD